MKKKILLFIVIAALTEGCKKYPEGPLISFSSEWRRLENKHSLIKYNVDGIDSLSLFYDSLGMTFDFVESIENHYMHIKGPRKDNKNIDIYWQFEWANNKKTKIELYAPSLLFLNSQGTGPFSVSYYTNSIVIWDLIKLEKQDIRMKTNYNGKEYYVELY